jgi:hypothetical protein
VNRSVARVLVGAFVLLDVVLVVGVMQHVNRTPPASADLPKVSAKPTKTAKPAGDQTTYKFNPARSSVISLANDQTLMYATRGQCDGDASAKLTVSGNGGASTSTADTGLKEILAVRAVSRSQLRVVGADSTCAVKRLVSSDGGDTWITDLDDDIWYPSPDNDQAIVSPRGTSKAGCTVTSLSQVSDDFARVSCSDGTIRGTGDGRKWLKLGRLDNVRVASFTTFNAGYALAVYQGCAAQEFTTRDGGRTWAPGGCISGEPAQAIGSNDTGLVAIVKSQLYASDNGGKTWDQP